ncbi:MAG TPA: glycosyltransferase [Candidatus Binatia bacterium]|nr:glycosyltransferase [Candidatus Binatia bacterium]
MLTVVISPYGTASFPEGGGHFWVYLQYALALRQLGCEVYWLEGFRSEGSTEREAAALATFRARTKEYGLDEKLILYVMNSQTSSSDAPQEYLDRERDEAEAVFARADLLINFHYAINPGLLARFRRTALIDIDPGLLQFWMSRGQLSVPRHDVYFTTGEGLGRPGGTSPDCGLPWTQIRPAVCLEQWPYVFDPRSETFTTISNWDSSDWVVDLEESYENTKRVAFLEFADLPQLTNQPLELALFLRTERDLAEQSDLEKRGWRIRHSPEVAATPQLYQSYIQHSRGEFSCAKRSYRKFKNAWVSDRTLCYLASGKPVVVQDTGPSAFLPNGEGMFRFSTPKGAAKAIETVNQDYEKHCRAARQLAETFFDAKQVAKEILNHALA